MRTLFELSEEAYRLFDLMERHAEASGGEIPPDLEAEIDKISNDRSIKIGNICSVYKEMVARADVLKAEADRLSARAKASRNQAEALKSYLARNLKPGEKFENERHRVGWGTSSSVELMPGIAVEDIPELFQRRGDVTFNKEEAKRGIAAGEDLWFCELKKTQYVKIG